MRGIGWVVTGCAAAAIAVAAKPLVHTSRLSARSTGPERPVTSHEKGPHSSSCSRDCLRSRAGSRTAGPTSMPMGPRPVRGLSAGRGEPAVSKRQGTFVDVAAEAACGRADTRAAAWGDFDRDGRLDLYVGFTRKSDTPTSSIGTRAPASSTSQPTPCGREGRDAAAVVDRLDNDGDLDLFVAFRDAPNALYENDDGRLRNIGKEVASTTRAGRWVPCGSMPSGRRPGCVRRQPEWRPERVLPQTTAPASSTSRPPCIDAAGRPETAGATVRALPTTTMATWICSWRATVRLPLSQDGQ